MKTRGLVSLCHVEYVAEVFNDLFNGNHLVEYLINV